jgi:ABC-type uncharacterized transport system permease subunit
MYLIFFSYMMITFPSGAFFDSIEQFFRNLHDGLIDPHLTRPYSLPAIIFFRWCNPVKLALALCLALFGGLIPFMTEVDHAPANHVLMYWLTVAAAVVANVSLFVLLHLPACLGMRVPPADYIQSEIQQLSTLPVSLFPQKALPAFLVCVPVAVGASVAAQVLRFGADQVVALFALGTLIVVGVCIVSTKAAFKRFNSLGG